MTFQAFSHGPVSLFSCSPATCEPPDRDGLGALLPGRLSPPSREQAQCLWRGTAPRPVGTGCGMAAPFPARGGGDCSVPAVPTDSRSRPGVSAPWFPPTPGLQDKAPRGYDVLVDQAKERCTHTELTYFVFTNIGPSSMCHFCSCLRICVWNVSPQRLGVSIPNEPRKYYVQKKKTRNEGPGKGRWGLEECPRLLLVCLPIMQALFLP